MEGKTEISLSEQKMNQIGLIAGNGRFPILFAQNAREAGLRIIAVGIKNETLPEIEEYVDKLYWVGLAQIGKLIKILKSEKITKAVMAGGVTKGKMYSKFRHLRFRPDLRTVKLWYKKVRDKKDHSLLAAVADELAQDGIELQDSTLYLSKFMARRGCMTIRQPTREEMKDIEFGWGIAKEIARMEIGQCIVVKEQAVIAVEGVEGTDETVRRGGRLGGGRVVVIKVSKPSHDVRFDVPTIGTNTIETLKDAGASVLAVEAEKTLILDVEETIEAADREGIALIGV